MSKLALLGLAVTLSALCGCATSQPNARPVVSDDAVREALAHHGEGAKLLQEGRIAHAIRELRAAAALNPNDPGFGSRSARPTACAA